MTTKESGLGLQMRVEQNQHVKTVIKKTNLVLTNVRKENKRREQKSLLHQIHPPLVSVCRSSLLNSKDMVKPENV